MTTHFTLRAGIIGLAAVIVTALFTIFTGIAHADWYGNYTNSWYHDETYVGPTWDWNAQSGLGSDTCDGDFDLDDSSCIMTPGYHGYGGGGYSQQHHHNAWWNTNDGWNGSTYFGNPLFW